jgi:hypothetical protein
MKNVDMAGVHLGLIFMLVSLDPVFWLAKWGIGTSIRASATETGFHCRSIDRLPALSMYTSSYGELKVKRALSV